MDDELIAKTTMEIGADHPNAEDVQINASHIVVHVETGRVGDGDVPPMGIAIGPCIVNGAPHVLLQLIDADGSIATTMLDEEEVVAFAHMFSAASAVCATMANAPAKGAMN